MKYLITPLNEGQEMNYSEVQKFTDDRHAKIYADVMAENLSKILVQADITVSYEKLIWKYEKLI